jgi:hypothetical protein
LAKMRRKRIRPPHSVTTSSRRPSASGTQLGPVTAQGQCSVALGITVFGGMNQLDRDIHQLPTSAAVSVTASLCRWAGTLRHFVRASAFKGTMPTISFLDTSPRWMFRVPDPQPPRYRWEDYRGLMDDVRLHVDCEGLWWTTKIRFLSTTLSTTLLRFDDLLDLTPEAGPTREDQGPCSSLHTRLRLLEILPDVLLAIGVKSLAADHASGEAALRRLTRRLPRTLESIQNALTSARGAPDTRRPR